MTSMLGYTCIRGALSVLGMFFGRSTIQRILTDHGIEPAPERGKHTRWRTFLRAHWGAIAAATDFFSIEVLTWTRARPSLRAVRDRLKSRRVEIVGIVHQPHEAWMKQLARSLTEGRIPARQVEAHSRLGSALHRRVASQERERLRRALRALDQVQVPEPRHAARRGSPSAARDGVRRALSPGALGSRLGQRAGRRPRSDATTTDLCSGAKASAVC
jgi:hypothetical protein